MAQIVYTVANFGFHCFPSKNSRWKPLYVSELGDILGLDKTCLGGTFSSFWYCEFDLKIDFIDEPGSEAKTSHLVMWYTILPSHWPIYLLKTSILTLEEGNFYRSVLYAVKNRALDQIIHGFIVPK